MKFLHTLKKLQINQIVEEIKQKCNIEINNSTVNNETKINTIEYHQICLPYKEEKGSDQLKNMSKDINKVLPVDHITRITFT